MAVIGQIAVYLFKTIKHSSDSFPELVSCFHLSLNCLSRLELKKRSLKNDCLFNSSINWSIYSPNQFLGRSLTSPNLDVV